MNPKNENSIEETEDKALSYWRMRAADEFDEAMRNDVAACVASIYASRPDVRAAISGDADAAIGLALQLKTPSIIGFKVDLLMTVLLNAAFIHAGAASVLANALERMPIDPSERSRLAKSWATSRGRLGLERNRPRK